MNTFKYKDNGLSEEHIKQICRFLDKPYVKGEYQKWHKFSQFKFWHKGEMDRRDAAFKFSEGLNRVKDTLRY